MSKVLVIIPCGQAKVWDDYPDHSPTKAANCYMGAPFKVNKEYAMKYGDQWIILSAKYGFISPDFIISEPYNVTFKRSSTNPISLGELKKQVVSQQLDKFETVIGLGGKEYRSMIAQVFSGTNAKVLFPFAGLPIGKAMQAIRKAIANINGGIDMTLLERQFHEDMKDIYFKAKKECKYVATRFMQMVGEKGGVSAAKSLISKEGGTEGFAKLWELGRLDLSVEKRVLEDKYKELFTEEERTMCRERLEKYGYKI